MGNKTLSNPELISITPFELGVEASKLGISIHDNPFKSPNKSKTDSVKSDAWICGFNDHKHVFGPV